MKPLIKNKRGQFAEHPIVTNIMMMLIIMFFILIFFVMYYIYSLIAPPASYIINDVANIVQGEADNSDGNLSLAANLTISSANRAIQTNIQWFSYGILLAGILAFIIVAFFVRAYPFLMIYWIIFGIIIVVVSIFMSIGYSDIRVGDDYLGAAYQSWTGNDYIMQYLPYIASAFFLITGTILFLVISTKDIPQEAYL